MSDLQPTRVGIVAPRLKVIRNFVCTSRKVTLISLVDDEEEEAEEDGKWATTNGEDDAVAAEEDDGFEAAQGPEAMSEDEEDEEEDAEEQEAENEDEEVEEEADDVDIDVDHEAIKPEKASAEAVRVVQERIAVTDTTDADSSNQSSTLMPSKSVGIGKQLS